MLGLVFGFNCFVVVSLRFKVTRHFWNAISP